MADNDSEVPRSGPAFFKMMQETDAELIAAGYDITRRPIFAEMAVSKKYNLTLPSTDDLSRVPLNLRENAKLGASIRQWYRETYGDRLKVDMSVGKIVVLVDGDLYILRIPMFMGQVRFTPQRTWIKGPSIGRGPVICNVVQLLDGMTPVKAAQLSDGALQAIWEAFEIALPACHMLLNTPSGLMHIALGDVAVAIANLTDKFERFGESKWASLQAAEKMMKAAIEMKVGVYKQTHILSTLSNQLKALGVCLGADAELAAIQCTPAVRYGQEPCTRAEALAAHHASLRLATLLHKAGVNFQTGIGGPVS